MLNIKDNLDLKELEKYGWELDTLNCFDICSNCKIKNCSIKENQNYYKDISEILHYTIITTNKNDRVIYGYFDDYKTILPNDEDYKYVEKACIDLIKDGLVEKVDD